MKILPTGCQYHSCYVEERIDILYDPIQTYIGARTDGLVLTFYFISFELVSSAIIRN